MGRDRIPLRDWAIAVGVAVTQVVAGLSGQHQPTSLDALGYALLGAGGMALVARRRAPVAVLAVTAVCGLGHQVVGFDVPVVAYLFAVYFVVRAGHRVVGLVGSVTMLLALPLVELIRVGDLGEALEHSRGALEIAWLIAAGAAGEALRQAEFRADEAERTREETARRRADEERLHIARELHDSLTHQISVIKVQAEAAVHVAQRRGEPVPEALRAIRDAGREASRDLRATLEVLRGDDANPPLGLDNVPDLVHRARTGGLEVTLAIEAQPVDVPTAVDRAAYRVVQESLTNVARHAGAATAVVRIDYRPDALVVQVDDDGVATPQTPVVPGVGLAGMRERATALGGRLRAAPRTGGGFTVHAEFPVGGPS